MSMSPQARAALARIESRIDRLPLLPEVLLAVMRLDSAGDDYFDRVQDLVRSDPAFAIRLLRYANSAAVASRTRVDSLERALSVVGCEAAVGLVLAQSAVKVFVPRSDWERDLWRHAFDVACLMQSLAALVSPKALDPRKAYLFGLLHDVGRFLLYLEASDELRRVDETRWASLEEMVLAETAICGFTHAELGARAILKWHLPEELASAIRRHHAPPEAPGRALVDDESMLRLLRDADGLSVQLALRDERWRTQEPEQIAERLGPNWLGSTFALAPAALISPVCLALEHSAAMQAAFGIAPPARAASI